MPAYMLSTVSGFQPVEFIDDDWHLQGAPTSPLGPPPPELDPWAGFHGCVVVSLELLNTLAQPKRLAEIVYADRDRIGLIATDIQANGLREPLEIVIDGQGRVALRDGHHRVLACQELGLSDLPVRISHAESLRIDCLQTKDILFRLLAESRLPQEGPA